MSGCTYTDRRIKKNIVDVPDNLALTMVREIPCRYYEYKDTALKGTQKTIGFIAQEVKEVFPLAITISSKIIPNELRQLENFSWEEKEYPHGSGGNTIIKYNLISDLQDVSGIKYRFYVSNDISGNDEEKEEIIGNSDDSFTFDQSWNNVYCYGKEVDDFHTLHKQKLFTLNFSATQEIDRIQQQEITKVQTLQTDLSTANTIIQQQATKITTLETQIADILSRLSVLENSN